jgi:hypothetical protein
MTFIPAFIAVLQMGTRAFISFAEIAIPSTFRAINEPMISICPSAVGVLGPR